MPCASNSRTRDASIEGGRPKESPNSRALSKPRQASGAQAGTTSSSCRRSQSRSNPRISSILCFMILTLAISSLKRCMAAPSIVGPIFRSASLARLVASRRLAKLLKLTVFRREDDSARSHLSALSLVLIADDGAFRRQFTRPRPSGPLARSQRTSSLAHHPYLVQAVFFNSFSDSLFIGRFSDGCIFLAPFDQPGFDRKLPVFANMPFQFEPERGPNIIDLQRRRQLRLGIKPAPQRSRLAVPRSERQRVALSAGSAAL